MNIGIAATIKHHPYASAGIAVGGLFLLLVLMRSSGGDAAASSNAGTLQTIAAANAQQSQLAAQVGAQQSTLAAQNYQSNLAAQVQNNQVVAAGNAATYQTDAALIAALASNQTQQQATQAQLAAAGMQVDLQAQNNYLTADTANRNIAAQLAAMGIQSSTSLQALGIQSDAQTRQLGIQSDAQNAQMSMQLNAQNAANNLAAQIQQHQMDTQLAGLQTQTQAQMFGASLEQQTYVHQMDTQLAATEDTNAANLAAYNAQFAYQTNLANLQGALTSKQIDSTTQLTSQGIWAQLQAIFGQQATDQQGQQLQYNYASQLSQNQYNLNNQIVGMVGQAGLNHGTASLENSLTSILAGVMNQPAIGVAAQQTSQVQAESTASMWSNITNAIAGVANTVAGGLFNPISGIITKTPVHAAM